jgi:hypothetical protein
MSFTAKQYAEIFDFAEAAYLLAGDGPFRREASRIMDMCEEVVGQLRPHDSRMGKVDVEVSK